MSTGSRTIVGLGFAALFFNSGCATLEIPWFDRTPQASRWNPVMQVVCMWEASEGRDPEGAPCRGFAGQILFLGNKGGTPVQVDGDVSIYVFDDMGTEEEQGKPIHQFNFDAGAWNRHMKVGSLGPAYHCFIPYTRPGSYEANCTLRLKFTPKEGQGLTSDASNVALQGKSRTGDPELQYASRNPQVFETSRPGDARSSRTTTIPLDPRGRFEESSSGVVPASHSDEDRVRQVLDEYRREQESTGRRAAGDPRTSASPRLKLAGPQTELASNRLPPTSEPGTTRDGTPSTPDFLSSHPLSTAYDGAAHVPTREHPLRESRTLTNGHPRVQAATYDPWVPASEADSTKRSEETIEDIGQQTTSLDR